MSDSSVQPVLPGLAVLPQFCVDHRNRDTEDIVSATSPLEAALTFLREHPDLAKARDVLFVNPFEPPDAGPRRRFVVQKDGTLRERVAPVEFLEEALGHKLRADQRRYLVGPMIFHGPWAETLPAWLEAAVPKARVIQVLIEDLAGVGEYDWMCTLEEVVAYLYTAFFEFPPSQEWTRVYLWAGNRVLQAHGKLPAGQSIWDLIGDVGLGRQELSDYDQREYLDRLRRDIRRAVVKHRKKREKTARRTR